MSMTRVSGQSPEAPPLAFQNTDAPQSEVDTEITAIYARVVHAAIDVPALQEPDPRITELCAIAKKIGLVAIGPHIIKIMEGVRCQVASCQLLSLPVLKAVYRETQSIIEKSYEEILKVTLLRCRIFSQVARGAPSEPLNQERELEGLIRALGQKTIEFMQNGGNLRHYAAAITALDPTSAFSNRSERIYENLILQSKNLSNPSLEEILIEADQQTTTQERDEVNTLFRNACQKRGFSEEEIRSIMGLDEPKPSS